MDDFLDILAKIQSAYLRRMQMLFILDLISFFGASYAISLIIFRSSLNPSSSLLSMLILPVSSFIIAIVGAFLLHRNDSKINMPSLIESKYPELKEKLRTAYDNRTESNVIVDALKDQISNNLPVVTASHLLNTSIIVTKLIMVMVAVSGAAFISETPGLGLPPGTLGNISHTITGTVANVTNATFAPQGPPTDLNKAGAAGQGDIFGKPNIAPIQGKPVDLTLDQGTGIGNAPKDYNPTQNQFIRSAAFPVDVQGSNVSDGGYSALMSRTETEKQIISKYASERNTQ